MAFDFLGTFNESQWNRLKGFLQTRLESIPARITHLEAEIARIGTFQVIYDEGGNPTDYSVSPGTHLDKLFKAFLVSGGDPFYDLQIRDLNNPVYLFKEDESTVPERLSSGDILGTAGLADTPSALLISKVKAPFLRDIQRISSIQRKILRLVDYTDALSSELSDLRVFVQAAEAAGSFANLSSQVEELLDDPDYPAIYRDGGKDPYGRYTHAPFAGYEPGPSRPPMDQTVRTSKGVVLRGKDSV